jgi:hypothetical protein
LDSGGGLKGGGVLGVDASRVIVSVASAVAFPVGSTENHWDGNVVKSALLPKSAEFDTHVWEHGSLSVSITEPVGSENATDNGTGVPPGQSKAGAIVTSNL